MSLHRVVCVSDREPVCSAHDVLAVCHGFPSRKAQSGIRGRVLCVGEQFFLFLEGSRESVESLVSRLQREVPEAGMQPRELAPSDEWAFDGWSIGDVYLDEIGQRDVAAAERLGDVMIDLLAGPADDDTDEEQDDPFAQLAAILDHFAWTPRRVVAERRVAA